MEKIVLSGTAYCSRYMGLCPYRQERDGRASCADIGQGNDYNRPSNSTAQKDIERGIEDGT